MAVGRWRATVDIKLPDAVGVRAMQPTAEQGVSVLIVALAGAPGELLWPGTHGMLRQSVTLRRGCGSNTVGWARYWCEQAANEPSMLIRERGSDSPPCTPAQQSATWSRDR